MKFTGACAVRAGGEPAVRQFNQLKNFAALISVL